MALWEPNIAMENHHFVLAKSTQKSAHRSTKIRKKKKHHFHTEFTPKFEISSMKWFSHSDPFRNISLVNFPDHIKKKIVKST